MRYLSFLLFFLYSSLAIHSPSFTFAIVADRTGWPREGVFEKATALINELNPDFVMSVGDLNAKGYTHNLDVISTGFDEMDTLLSQFDNPFYKVAGNHDISNAMMLKEWNARYGKEYYYFLKEDILFLVLSSEDLAVETSYTEGGIDREQAVWAVNLLRSIQVRHTFVFMHKPLWEMNDPGWLVIQEVLGEYTAFAGHLHNYKQSGNHYRLATTGGVQNGTGIEYDHFMIVEVGETIRIINRIFNDG